MSDDQSLETAPKDGTRFVGFVRSRFTKRIEPVSAYWCEGLKEPRFIFNNWTDHTLLDHWCPLPPH